MLLETVISISPGAGLGKVNGVRFIQPLGAARFQ